MSNPIILLSLVLIRVMRVPSRICKDLCACITKDLSSRSISSALVTSGHVGPDMNSLLGVPSMSPIRYDMGVIRYVSQSGKMTPVVPSWKRGGGEGERGGDGRSCLARVLSSSSTRCSSCSFCSRILLTSSSCLSILSCSHTYLSMFLLALFIAISLSVVQGSTFLSSGMSDSVEGVV